MKTFWSPSIGATVSVSRASGVTIEKIGGTGEQRLHLHAASCANDWTEVSAEQVASLPFRQRTQAAVTLAQSATLGLSASTTDVILEELEQLLEAGIDSTKVLCSLCVAPLNEASRAETLAAAAISKRRFASADIFSRVHENQPHIRRLSDAWLRVPFETISASGFSPSVLWRALVEASAIIGVLDAIGKRDHRALRHAWNPLVLYLGASAAGRNMALARIGQKLADGLALQHNPRRAALAREEQVVESDRPMGQLPRGSVADRKDRALTQVEAVIDQVNHGNDARAHRFLAELIRDQKGEPEHLIKSLCNIAQRCKEIFRSDFERFCLREALELSPNDPWTLIQWGNHLKDCRSFSEARTSFNLAKTLSNDLTPDHCLADLLAAEDRFDDALRAYKSIPNWRESELVGTAIADVLRKTGRLDEAAMQYDYVLRHWPLSARARAGNAEIHQAHGNLLRSFEIYAELAMETQGTPDECHYMLMKGTILRRLRRIPEALSVADSALRRWPFNPAARYLRNSSLILAERFGDLDRDLPEASSAPGFSEWRRSFNRGLMLLCTSQFSAAREELVRGVASIGRVNSENGILAMAAAHALMHEQRFLEAKAMLQRTEAVDLQDEQLLHLRLVLRLHVATLLNDEREAERLQNEIIGSGQSEAVEAAEKIMAKNFSAANTCELRLFAVCG